MSKVNKLVYGVGINDAGYPTDKRILVDGKRKVVWMCPYYSRWFHMLTRCYSEVYQGKYPTYIGCTVCEEWLTFSNFKRWMETQKWEDRQLDKDFLFEGNKIYSPSTCVFIPQELNKFITSCGKVRGLYPIGVSYIKKDKVIDNSRRKPYRSEVNSLKEKRIYLGVYSTPQEAHQRYLTEKLKHCKGYLSKFKEEPLIIKGLTRIQNKIEFHIKNNLELTSF